jgi:FkbH-like protein
MYDNQAERPETLWWAGLKGDIARCLRESMHASFFLDLDDVMLQTGRANFFDLRLWYSSRFPFAQEGALELARRIAAAAAVVKTPKAKVIVLDADNTLWGGIIGEDGLHGVALGPDYPGNAYRDFQRRLLDFQQRGFILALASKNNPEDVAKVLGEHPHQLLREKHFAAVRVNWLPKPENLVSLAEELNLGLDSFVFVDDSPYECQAVAQALPQVEVVQVPAKPVDIPRCLDRVARLEILSLTAEDRAKTQLYAQERKRQELKREVVHGAGSVRDYLLSLRMVMQVGFDDIAQLARLAQLTQKTNQFNLTTRRYDERQIREFIESPDWMVAHFSLSDVFGESGVTGLALVHRVTPEQAELDSFLMSCRVIGREAECGFLNALLRRLAEHGVKEVRAEYRPSPKNKLVEAFLPGQCFSKQADGSYLRNLASIPPASDEAFPIAIQPVGESSLWRTERSDCVTAEFSNAEGATAATSNTLGSV